VGWAVGKRLDIRRCSMKVKTSVKGGKVEAQGGTNVPPTP
jgi:hypothetical protein